MRKGAKEIIGKDQRLSLSVLECLKADAVSEEGSTGR